MTITHCSKAIWLFLKKKNRVSESRLNPEPCCYLPKVSLNVCKGLRG